MTNPLLSIIIVSYNTADLTSNCIASILRDKGLSFDLSTSDARPLIPTEIIIVDNHSTDNTLQKIASFKPIKVITSKTNLGFGGGNNLGLSQAKGNFILFLNSDTVILHSSISQSVDWLSSHPEVSICTAQLLNPDKRIQMTGGFFPNLWNLFTWATALDDLPLINYLVKPIHPHTPDFYTHDPFFCANHSQDWVTGAFLLTRKSLIDQVKGFDLDYFMYGEELEMAYRIHQKYPDFLVYYLVGPQIIHFGQASAIKKSDPIVNEYLGFLNFFRKHKPRQFHLAKHFLLLNSYTRFLYYKIIGKIDYSGFYYQACQKILQF